MRGIWAEKSVYWGTHMSRGWEEEEGVCMWSSAQQDLSGSISPVSALPQGFLASRKAPFQIVPPYTSSWPSWQWSFIAAPESCCGDILGGAPTTSITH